MRILHISDLHIEPEPEVRLPGLMATLARDRAQLVAAGADLAIVTGDLTTFGYTEADHLRLARDWLDDLGIPYLAVPGNHDLNPAPELGAYEDVPYAETRYARFFGAEPVLVRETGPVRIIGAAIRENDPDGVLPELDELLAADPRPVILATHYPVLPVREPRIHQYFGSEAFVPQATEALLDLIRRHRNVAVYACGHVHVNSARRLAPHCLQITAGSLGQGSSTYRIFDLDRDGLTFTTALGSGPLTFWEDNGVPDLPRDFSLGPGDERSGRVEWVRA